MPKWKKDATEFNVRINQDGHGGNVCRIPKPLMDLLGNPDTVRFSLKRNNIITLGTST